MTQSKVNGSTSHLPANGREPAPEPGPRAVQLSDNARLVLEKRYLRRGADGQPAETIPDMFWRVAHHVALAEREWGGSETDIEQHFYDLLTSLRFFPNSPTFTGAGTPLGQLAACFVLKIEDDMGRSEAGIFQTLRDAALIQQTGGGNGFSFSRLRPKAALVKSSSGEATGPVGFLRVYDKAFGEIAQGGCLLPETLVFTARGLLRLDEIADKQQPGWQEHDLEVATDEGWRSSPRAFNNGLAPVLRVHTRAGLSLAGTPQHRVKVMTAGGPEWRMLKDLAPGDWVIVQLGQHRGKLQALRQPRPARGNQVRPRLPSVLDEETAFFLGYLAGGGFVAAQPGDHRLGVTVAHNSYLMVEMPALVQRLFGVQAHVSHKPDDRSATLLIDSRAVQEWFHLNGLDQARGRGACVPRLVRQSPPEVVGAYLRGLFEAGGSLSHGCPALSTTSPQLAEEVAALLIGLGCPVRVRSVHHGVNHFGAASLYHLRIESCAGLRAWRRRIGCDTRSRFVAALSWEADPGRESAYALPHARYWFEPVLQAIPLEQVDAGGRGLGGKSRGASPALRRSLLRYARGGRQFTRSAYDELCRAYGEFATLARPVADRWFVRVEAVQPAGEALTLDLEVAGNHTYLANGLVTHNTRRGANMAVLRCDHPDIEEFITCKTDENAITNFNISVGVTGDFMRAVAADDWWELRFPEVGAPEYRGFYGTLDQAERAGLPIRVYKRVKARELFGKIVAQAHHNGEPGVLFLDAANRENPVPHLYELEATNPCHRGSNLIHTTLGVVPIRDLVNRQFGVVTPGGDVVEAVAFPTGIKPLYRVQLDNGMAIDLTANHNLITVDGQKARVSQLKPGDRLMLARQPIAPDQAEFQFSEEEGMLLGWNAGDGWITFHANKKIKAWQVGFVFGRQDEAIARWVIDRVVERVGASVRIPGLKPRADRGILELATTNKNFTRYFIENLGAIKKRQGVPETVLRGNREFQRGYLRGLFSSDGYVSVKGKGPKERRQLGLVTAHEQLARQVQVLLSTFGIISRLRHSQSRLAGRAKLYQRWQITINADQFVSFMEQIGFMPDSAKQAVAEKVLEREWRETHSATYGTVVAVEPLGMEEPVFNLTVNHPRHQFAVNGLISANCGEQWLGPFENCCLGSINLAQHRGSNGAVDWEKLRESTVLSTRFLDDVVSANAYVPAVPQLKRAALAARRIGLGIMGLGDLMYHAGIRYGSAEAQEFAAQVMEFVRYHCMLTSVELARQRGPFEALSGSLYDPADLRWAPPTPLAPYQHDHGRPALDWQQVVDGLRAHGIRNACQTTVAPTGTIATVAGCEAYGCEPVFALAYIRHVNDRGRDLKLTYASPLFERALIQAGLGEAERARLVEQVLAQGTCQDLADLPAAIRHTFVVSQDISAEEHVRMQAAIQRFVDNSLSKCVTGDTLVLTAHGLTPIADLSEMRLDGQFAPLAIEVVTPAGVETTDAFYYGGMRETRQVRLSYGYQVEGTPNHRVQVVGQDGQIGFARLDELKLGDTVVLYGGQQIFGPAAQPLPRYLGEQRASSKTNVFFPRSMSVELAYLLGCLTSEGAITRNGVAITHSDQTLLERLAQLFQRLFGLDSAIYQDLRRASVYTLQVNSRALRHWLLGELRMETGPRNKLIPTCLLRASRLEMAAFLRGLFLDGYMTRDGRMFGIGLASKGLIRQLQTVLLNFGVVASWNRSADHAWTLSVSGAALERLAAFVEFDEVWKADRLSARHEGRQHHLFNYINLLPPTVTEHLRQAQTASERPLRALYGEQTPAYQRARVNLLQGHRLSRQAALELRQHFGDVTDPYLDAFFSHDAEGQLYVEVEALETGFAEVFDLSVPGSHSFVANGLGNHNTCNFPEGASEADVAQAYQLAWELGCKGLTVYVTGSREKVVLETHATARAKDKDGPAAEGILARAAPAPLPMFHENKKPRPTRLRGSTIVVSTPLGKSFVTVNENGGQQPFEVFITTAKAGSETAAISEAIGRLISYILRLASPVAPRDRLQEVIRQLAGIGTGRSIGIGPNRVASLPDGVARALVEYVSEEPAPDPRPPGAAPDPAVPASAAHAQLALKIGDICPECGAAALINEEGCRKCYSCGYSQC